MKSIKLKDGLYGTYIIKSPVIIELLNSQAVLRLKHISQLGPPDQYYHVPNYSRYSHSVGVMLLLKKLGASEEEQIAGLLHDVSHTAFSHLIDWVIGSGHLENYQDNQHQEFLSNTDIPNILQKYDFDIQNLINYHNYPLLEQKIPNLCADRIDYALREFPPSVLEKSINHLVVFNKKIAFSNVQSALLFATHFLKRQQNHWGSYEAVSRYYLFSQALQELLKEKTIAISDFNNTEKYILSKLHLSNNQRVINILNVLRNKKLPKLQTTKKLFYKKFRYVDPYIVRSDKLIRLSSYNKKFKQLIKRARKINAKGVRSGTIDT